MDKKDRVFFLETKKNSERLFGAIEDAVKGLIYVSEIDSAVVGFAGVEAGEVSEKTILQQLGCSGETVIEMISFEEFFARLTALKDWFGERETISAKKFLELKRLLEENLSDLKVFRIGNVRIDIFAVGIDTAGRLVGVRTKAVET